MSGPRVRRVSINRNDAIIINNQVCGWCEFKLFHHHAPMWHATYEWNGQAHEKWENSKTKLLQSIRLSVLMRPRLIVDNSTAE